MTQRLGKYAALRPEGLDPISNEFKRDLLDIDPALGGSKSKRRKSKTDATSDSDASSQASSDDERKKSKKKSRRRRRRKSSRDRDDSGRKRRRKRSSSRDRDRKRRPSGDDRKSRKEREPSPASSYKSPSNVEEDSDLESDGLDLKHTIDPLIYYLKEDREHFNRQIFRIIRGRRRRHLMPKVLRDIPDKELKQTCLSELARWSNKRCRILMRTGKLLESSDEEAIAKMPSEEDSTDTETLNEQNAPNGEGKMDDGETSKEVKVNGEAKEDVQAKVNSEPKEGEPSDTKDGEKKEGDGPAADDTKKADAPLVNGTTKETKKEKKSKKSKKEKEPEPNPDHVSSDEEDIAQMRANLSKWRKQRLDDELSKLRARQAKELEEHEAECAKEQELLERELEEKKKAKQKIFELSQKLEEVGQQIAKEEGLVLVEKMTLKKEKKKDDSDGSDEEENESNMTDLEVDLEGNVILQNEDLVEGKKEASNDAHSSLNVGDGDSSDNTVHSNNEEIQNADDIPLADSPSRQQQQGGAKLNKPKKEDKKDKKKKKKKKGEEEQEDAKRPNLCPDQPASLTKKERKNMVKQWLANIGRDGPALPVPEENYYPDYADPNTQNALKEIEDLQAAYEMERAKKGRTDGKTIQKLTGEEVFAEDEEDGKLVFDEIDPNDKNAVAKRMLQTMLKREHAKKIDPPQPNYKSRDTTKYTDVKRESRTIGPDSAGLVYQRDKEKSKGSLSLSKDKNIKKEADKGLGLGGAAISKSHVHVKKEAKEESKDQDKMPQKVDGTTIRGDPNDMNRSIFDTRPVNAQQTRREKMEKLETEMRARAIKAMMERMQEKKKQAKESIKKEKEHEGEFPWQEDYDEDEF